MSKDSTVVINGVPSKVFYVEKLVGKAVRGASALADFVADQRLKPENMAADIEKKRAKFAAEADDNYAVSDFELALVDLTDYIAGDVPRVSGEAVKQATLVASASELPKKLKSIVDNESALRIVLVGEDVDVITRNILRFFVEKPAGAPQISYRDLRPKLVFDAEWKQLNELGRNAIYYKDRSKLEFYVALVDMFGVERDF